MNFDIYKEKIVDQHFLGMLLQINADDPYIIIRGSSGEAKLIESKQYNFYDDLALAIMKEYNKIDGRIIFSKTDKTIQSLSDYDEIIKQKVI